MVASGDLDHRFYEYPGLVFLALYPVVYVAASAGASDPTTYLAARALVAGFGVASCALLFALGRQYAGAGAGLIAALLLAVSPVAVESAHTLRPDVVLQSFTILTLLGLRRLGTRLRDDASVGLCLGLAGGTKFTGVLLLPCYLAARFMAPGRRLRGALLAGAAALAAFVLVTPYAMIRLDAFAAGIATQLGYHYVPSNKAPISYPAMVGVYLEVWREALGIPGTLLSVAGLALAARAWREWLPLLLLPASAIAVFATSDVRHERFLLPALSVAFLLAAYGIVRLSERHAVRGVLAGVAALPPLAATLVYVAGVGAPSTRDRVQDWMNGRPEGPARVLNGVEELGIGRASFEVLDLPRLGAANRALALEMDYVVASPDDDAALFDGLQPAFVAEPERRFRGPRLTVFTVPSELRPRYLELSIDPLGAEASDAMAGLPALWDGRLDTFWTTQGHQRRGDFLVFRLRRPAALARIELVVADRPRLAARRLRVSVGTGDGAWVPAAFVHARPAPEAQPIEPASQVMLLTPPLLARAVRIEQSAHGARRLWGAAEIRLQALSGE